MNPTVRSRPFIRAFISYSSPNSAEAEALRKVVEEGGIPCFYAPTDIRELEIWRNRLESEIQRADVILLLYTETAGNSDEVYRETELAHQLGKDIWLLKDAKIGIAAPFHKFEIGARYQAFVFEQGQS
jgi:hypothetical protein